MIEALGPLLTAATFFNVVWATLLGITLGAMPGLTVTMGLALLTTLTYGFEPTQAILVLLCVYVGAIYGGSRSAILLNIPGTPANAATALDGYPIARRGEAAASLGLATSASAIGGLIGIFCLLWFAPMLAELALGFGSFEYFWLGLFGILIAGQMTSADDPLKGWIAGFLGLFVAMIGQETLHAHVRFAFGNNDLAGGIALIPAMVGAFGLAEALIVLYQQPAAVLQVKIKAVVPRLRDIWRNKFNVGRSGLIGTAIGIIPGVGEDIASWIAYAAARRSSRAPEKFGKGSEEGLISAETANNAAVAGAIIPALTLAVPGSAPAAVLLAALFIHNVRPGPFIMIEAPHFVFQVFWMMAFAMVAMATLGLLLTRPLLLILRIPSERLMPAIFVLCVIGPYALSQRLFDVYVMVVFGILGFALRQMRYPMAPLILGIILGAMIDQNLRRSLQLARGDPIQFIDRPLSAIFCALCVATILFGIPAVRRFVGNRLGTLVGRRP